MAQDVPPWNIVSVGDDCVCNHSEIYDSQTLHWHLDNAMFTDHDSYGGMSFCTNGATAQSIGNSSIASQDYWTKLVNETRVDVLAFCLGTSDAAFGVWDEE